MEVINIVTDMGSSLVVYNSDRCVWKKKQVNKRLKTWEKNSNSQLCCFETGSNHIASLDLE